MIDTKTLWPSPAKLNLFLYINGRRSDGYHELQTLFQFVEFGDELEITATDNGEITLSPDIDGVPVHNNLIYRAAKALQDISHTSYGAHIHINKVLPMGGGIGGGSSNAATTLVALNYLWQTQLTTEQLANIGLKLGADVPVFIRGHAAFAEGVGEQLTPVSPEEKCYLVVRPNVSISTADVFSHPELTRSTPKRTLQQLLSNPYVNDCEKIVRMLYPEVDKQLSWLLKYAPSRLTGTGSCIFAEFRDEKEALRVKNQLPDDVFAFVSRGRNTSPLAETLAKYQKAINHSL